MLALMIVFGLTLPWLGWLFGRSDMKKIIELLRGAGGRPGA